MELVKLPTAEDELIAKAKLAEQMERYEDMVKVGGIIFSQGSRGLQGHC